MEEIASAKQLIDLVKKCESFELKVLGKKVYYKRMTMPEAVVYLNADDSPENLFYYTLCNSKGEKLFKDKSEAKEFTDNIPVQEYPGLLRAIREFNFPAIDVIAGNS